MLKWLAVNKWSNLSVWNTVFPMKTSISLYLVLKFDVKCYRWLQSWECFLTKPSSTIYTNGTQVFFSSMSWEGLLVVLKRVYMMLIRAEFSTRETVKVTGEIDYVKMLHFWFTWNQIWTSVLARSRSWLYAFWPYRFFHQKLRLHVYAKFF